MSGAAARANESSSTTETGACSPRATAPAGRLPGRQQLLVALLVLVGGRDAGRTAFDDLEGRLAVRDRDLDRAAPGQATEQQLVGQRPLDVLLDHPRHR